MSDDLASRTHRRLLALVAVIVVATVAGMVALWPSQDHLPEASAPPEELQTGVIASVESFTDEADPVVGLSGEMVRLEVEVITGPDDGERITIETPIEGYPEFDVGDEVKLSPSAAGTGDPYYIVDFERLPALGWLLALFVLAVLAIGRWHGLRSLVGLGLSLMIVTLFIVPSILAGNSPFLVALVGALAVMIVTLYFSHGVNEMTTSAVVGTAFALSVTVILGLVFIDRGQLTGFSSEEANLARFAVEGLDLRGLVLAGLIIGALGVLDDVTVSQASTVFALHDTDRRQSWATLFRRAMSVGRDHIASTVNTLFLAYAGASMALLVLFATGGLPVAEIVNTEVFAEEAIKTLVGSLGLISAVPLTTALAATVAVRRPLDAPPLRGAHTHDHGPHRPHAPTSAAPPRPSPEDGGEPDGEPDEDEEAYRAWVRYLEGRDRGDPGEQGPPR